MAIVWRGPFHFTQDEKPGGPDHFVRDAYDDVDSNYSTGFELVGGDLDLVEFDSDGRLRLREQYLENYRGFETKLSGDNIIELIWKARHAWFNWDTREWVYTEGEQRYTYEITDRKPGNGAFDPNYGEVQEGSTGGTAILSYHFRHPITFDANQLGDGTGPTSVEIAPGSSGRFYLEKGANDVYALKVTPGVLIDYDTMEGSDSGLENLTINVSDGTTTVQRTFSVRIINNAPSAPTDANGASGGSLAEHAANGTSVGITASSTDPGGGTITYSFNDNFNGATYEGGKRFGLTINASTGVITVADSTKLDFEQTMDGSVQLAINATDKNGVTQTSIVTLDLQDRNDAPDFSYFGSRMEGFRYATSEPGVLEREQPFRENDTGIVGTIRAGDEDRLPTDDTLTYTLSGTDAADFTIDSATGDIRFKTAPNFEAPADSDRDGLYRFNVVASDGTVSTAQAVKVAVADVNEAPVIAGGATKTLSVVEGTSTSTVLYRLQATDLDSTALTYGLVGSFDSFSFEMDASGNLRFRFPPNYDFPDDQGQNHVYDITAYAWDGTTRTTQDIKVTVTEAIANRAPTITSNGGGATANVTVAENGKSVTTVKASDLDPGTSLTYSLAGGADHSRFAINASTGALTFKAAPDFETKADADRNGVYQVSVGVSDGALTDTQTLSVKVLDVAGITRTGSSAGETLTGTVEGDTLSGRAGKDTIKGLAGLDTLNGGTGADKLYGGVDNARDTFVFVKGDSGALKQGALTWDTIYDFRSGIDDIHLGGIDADAHLAGSQDLRLVTSFTKAVAKDKVADGQYRLVDDGAHVRLEIDHNGDTTADMVIRVMNVASLKAGSSGDFIL